MAEETSRRDLAVAEGAFAPTVSAVANYQNTDQPSNFVGITKNNEFAYAAARANIVSATAQGEANELALAGVRREGPERRSMSSTTSRST